MNVTKDSHSQSCPSRSRSERVSRRSSLISLIFTCRMKSINLGRVQGRQVVVLRMHRRRRSDADVIYVIPSKDCFSIMPIVHIICLHHLISYHHLFLLLSYIRINGVLGFWGFWGFEKLITPKPQTPKTL